jgi:hypothetical protein
MPHRCATWFVLAVLLCTPFTTGLAAAQEPLAVGAQDDNDGTDVLGAFGDSFKLLLIEHGWRIAFQEKREPSWAGSSGPITKTPFACLGSGEIPTRGGSTIWGIPYMGQGPGISGSITIHRPSVTSA